MTCWNCSKKGHFAKCCNSKNVANVDVESDDTVEEIVILSRPIVNQSFQFCRCRQKSREIPLRQ